MKNITFFITTYFMLLFIKVDAQEYTLLDKSDVLSKVKAENLSLKISQEEINKAKAEYVQTKAVFLPSVSASHTGFSTTNPLMAFGSKLNQGILTQADFNPSLLNNPNKTQNFATRLEVQQPILNLDGIYQRKAAKNILEATILQKQRAEDYLIFEIEKTFMELQLAYKSLEVLNTSLKAANENKKIIENYFEQGLVQKSEVLNINVNVTENQNQILAAKSNIQNISNYLSFLMNENSFKVYKPVKELALNAADVTANAVPGNRSDIKANELSVQAYSAMNKADKMAFLPRLNVFGSYELYDNTLFNGNANGYLIGASLSWDIFKGSKNIGKAQKSKAALEQQKLEYKKYVSKSNLELEKAKRMLFDARNNLSLNKLAVEQSQESLRILKNRFTQGLEKSNDILVAEAKYAQKQLAYYATIYQYNYALIYTQFLTKE